MLPVMLKVCAVFAQMEIEIVGKLLWGMKEGIPNLKPHIFSLTSPCIVGAQRDLLKNADTKYWSTFKGKK